MAIDLYRKGILELERGIAVDCWSGRGDVWDRAQRLHDKMQTNLSMAKDRLLFLGKLTCRGFAFDYAPAFRAEDIGYSLWVGVVVGVLLHVTDSVVAAGLLSVCRCC